MVFKEINKDSNLYCNSCFSRVAKVTVRFGTVNNAIAVRLCGECYGKLSSPQQEEPKWHKVADGDLPKNRRTVWITYINAYYQKETTEASFRHKYWVINGHRTECDVIAWCEIPKFEGE